MFSCRNNLAVDTPSLLLLRELNHEECMEACAARGDRFALPRSY